MDSIVALDLETTGLDPQKDSIIEIGAVKFKGDRIERFLINPPPTRSGHQSDRHH
jgi:DNA polymerase III epsilon subunit-like protein